MGKSKIEWLQGGKVWNPITGCTKVSEGCRHCYAERMSKRLAGRCGYPEDGFKVTLHPEKLDEPLRWKKPSRIFVCSMGDLFHEAVPDEFRDEVFAVMAACPQHTFMILTKRPKNLRDYILMAMFDENCNYEGWYEALERRGIPDASPVENVFCGVSVEDQKTADERIPLLLQTPVTKRFVSYEPALGPVDFERIQWPQKHRVDVLRRGGWDVPGCHPGFINHSDMNGLDWVIQGGESGPGARPMHPDWARSVRDQCKAAGVPFFFKQWGEWGITSPPLPEKQHPKHKGMWVLQCGGFSRLFNDSGPGKIWMERVGKKAAGCLLDGKEHKETP